MNQPEPIPSLKALAEQRAAMLAEAERVWRAYAKELEMRIPPSMQKWADEHGFIETVISDTTFWNLPDWLEHLVKNAAHSGEYPTGNSYKYREGELKGYGFANFDALKQGFTELAEAWKGAVRIRVDESERDRVEVCFYAAELTPEWPVSTEDDKE